MQQVFLQLIVFGIPLTLKSGKISGSNGISEHSLLDFNIKNIYYSIMKQKKAIPKRLIPKIELNLTNLILFGVGIIVLAIGFLLLSKDPWDNPLSLSVSPLVLLLGYLVIFPVAIFFGSRHTNGKGKNREKTE